MKIFINKIFILLAISVIVGSCTNDEDLTVLNPAASTIATLSANEIILEKSNIGQNALTVNWTQPEFGYNAAPSYQLLIDLSGGDFSAAQVISTGQELTYTFETEELNKLLIGLGVEPDVETALVIKVKVVLGSSTNINSDVNTLMATAYADALDLSSPWGFVGSYTEWGGKPDLPFYKIQGEPNRYVAYVNLEGDGEWKIRKDMAWDINYGDDGGDGTLELGGSNIIGTTGSFKIVFDEAALTYTMEKYSWGLVGDATENGWDGPDMPLRYDPFSDTWRAQVKLNDGEFKIRQNNAWSLNYGDDGPDGTLNEGGANIVVTFGYYEIIVNFNDLTYTFEKTEVWGVVGSGYNEWGAFADFPFQKDFSKEGVYFINDITLFTGEIKFRVNNDWGKNFGDTGFDGILDDGGDNIPSVAGLYDIIMDLSNPSVPTYTITAK